MNATNNFTLAFADILAVKEYTNFPVTYFVRFALMINSGIYAPKTEGKLTPYGLTLNGELVPQQSIGNPTEAMFCCSRQIDRFPTNETIERFTGNEKEEANAFCYN